MSSTYRERNWSGKRRLRALRENPEFRPAHRTYGGLRYNMFKIADGKKSVRNARLLSYHLHSYIIQQTSGEKKRAPFLKRVHRKIIFVHGFCCRVAEETNKYVLDHYMKDALVAYILLELDVLRDQGLIENRDSQFALVRRIKIILTTIYSKYYTYLTGNFDKIEVYEMIWKFLVSEPLNLPDFFKHLLNNIKDNLPPKPKNPDLPYFSINYTKPKIAFNDPLYALCGAQNTTVTGSKVIDLTDENPAEIVTEVGEPDPVFKPAVWRQLKYLRDCASKELSILKPTITRSNLKANTEICVSDSEEEDDKRSRLIYKPPNVTIDLTDEDPEEPCLMQPYRITEVGRINNNPLMAERVQSLLSELQQIAGTSNMVISVRDGCVEIDTRRRLENNEPVRMAIQSSCDIDRRNVNTPTNNLEIEQNTLKIASNSINDSSSNVAFVDLSEDLPPAAQGKSQSLPAILDAKEITNNLPAIEDASQIREISQRLPAILDAKEITNNFPAIEDASQIREISQRLPAILDAKEITNNFPAIENASQIIEISQRLPAILDAKESTNNFPAIEDASQIMEISQSSPTNIVPAEEIANDEEAKIDAFQIEPTSQPATEIMEIATVHAEEITNSKATEDSTTLESEDVLLSKIQPSAKENIEISQSKLTSPKGITNNDKAIEDKLLGEMEPSAQENIEILQNKDDLPGAGHIEEITNNHEAQIEPNLNKPSRITELEDYLLDEMEYIGSYKELDEDLLIGEDENGEKPQAHAKILNKPDNITEFVDDRITNEKSQINTGEPEAPVQSSSENNLLSENSISSVAEASESVNKLEETPSDNAAFAKVEFREEGSSSEDKYRKDENGSVLNSTESEEHVLISENDINLLPVTLETKPDTVQSNVAEVLPSADILETPSTFEDSSVKQSEELLEESQQTNQIEKLSDLQVSDKGISSLQQDNLEKACEDQTIDTGVVQEASNFTNTEDFSLILDQVPQSGQKTTDIGSSQMLDDGSAKPLAEEQANNILEQPTKEISSEVLPDQHLEGSLLGDSDIKVELESIAEKPLKVLTEQHSDNVLLADSNIDVGLESVAEKPLEVLLEQPLEDAMLADSNIELVSVAEKPLEVLPEQPLDDAMIADSVLKYRAEEPLDVLPKPEQPSKDRLLADSLAEAELEYKPEKPLVVLLEQPSENADSVAEAQYKPLKVLPVQEQPSEEALLADSVAEPELEYKAEKPLVVLPEQPSENSDSVAEARYKPIEVLPVQEQASEEAILADSMAVKKLVYTAENPSEVLPERKQPSEEALLAESATETKLECAAENPSEVLPEQEQPSEEALLAESATETKLEYTAEHPSEVLPEQEQPSEEALLAESATETKLECTAENPLEVRPEQEQPSEDATFAESATETKLECTAENPSEVPPEQKVPSEDALFPESATETKLECVAENSSEILPEQEQPSEDALLAESATETKLECAAENPSEVLPEQPSEEALLAESATETKLEYGAEKPLKVLPGQPSEDASLAVSVPEAELEYRKEDPIGALPETFLEQAPEDLLLADSVIEVEMVSIPLRPTKVREEKLLEDSLLADSVTEVVEFGSTEVSIEWFSETKVDLEIKPEKSLGLETPLKETPKAEKPLELQTKVNTLEELFPTRKVEPVKQLIIKMEASQEMFASESVDTTPSRKNTSINILSNVVMKNCTYPIQKQKMKQRVKTFKRQSKLEDSEDACSRRNSLRKPREHITGESPQTIELFNKFFPRKKIDFTQDPAIDELARHSRDDDTSTKETSSSDKMKEIITVELKQEEPSNKEQQISFPVQNVIPSTVNQQNTAADLTKVDNLSGTLVKKETKKLHRHSIEHLLALDEQIVEPEQFDSDIYHPMVSVTESIAPKDEVLDLKKPSAHDDSPLPPRRLSRKTSSFLSEDVLRNLPQDKIRTYYPDYSLYSRQLSDEINTEALNLSHSKEDYSKDALNLTTDKNNFEQFLDSTQTETIPVLKPEEQIMAPIEHINWQIATIPLTPLPLNLQIPDSYVTPNLLEPTKVPAAYMQSAHSSCSNNLLQLADLALHLSAVPDVPQGNSIQPDSPISTDSEGKLEIELPPEAPAVKKEIMAKQILSDPQVLKRPKTKAELKGVPEDSGKYSDDDVPLAARVKRDVPLVPKISEVELQSSESPKIVKRKPGRPRRISSVATKPSKKLSRKKKEKKAKKDPLPYTAKLRSRSLSSSEPEKIKEEPLTIVSPKPRSRKSSAVGSKEAGKAAKVTITAEQVVVVEKLEKIVDSSPLEPVIAEAAPKIAAALPKPLEISPTNSDAILATSPPFKKRFNFLKKKNTSLEETIAKVSVEVQRHQQSDNQIQDFKVENTFPGQCKIESDNGETLKDSKINRRKSILDDMPLSQLTESVVPEEERLVSSLQTASIVGLKQQAKNDGISPLSKEESQKSFLAIIELEKKVSDSKANDPMFTKKIPSTSKEDTLILPTLPDVKESQQEKLKGRRKRRISIRAVEGLGNEAAVSEEPILEPKVEDTLAALTTTELSNTKMPQTNRKRRSSKRASETMAKVEEPIPNKPQASQKRRASSRASEKPLAQVEEPILVSISKKEHVLEASTAMDGDNTETKNLSPQKRRASIRATEILLKVPLKDVKEEISGTTKCEITEVEKKKSQKRRACEGLLKKPLVELEQPIIKSTPEIETTADNAGIPEEKSSIPQKRRSSMRVSEIKDLVPEKTIGDLTVILTKEPVLTETSNASKKEESSILIKEAELPEAKVEKALPSVETTASLRLSKKAAASLHKPRRGRPSKGREPASKCKPEDEKYIEDKIVAQEPKVEEADVSKIPEQTLAMDEATIEVKNKSEDTKSSVTEITAEVAEEPVVAEKPNVTETGTKSNKPKAKKSSATETITAVAKNKLPSENTMIAGKSSVTETIINDEVIENKSKKSELLIADKSTVSEKPLIVDKESVMEKTAKGTKNKSKKSSTSIVTEINSDVAKNNLKPNESEEPFVAVKSSSVCPEAAKEVKKKSKQSNARQKNAEDTKDKSEKSNFTEKNAEVTKNRSKKSSVSEKTPTAEMSIVVEKIAETSLVVAEVAKCESKKSSESERTQIAEKLIIAETVAEGAENKEKLSSSQDPLVNEESSIAAKVAENRFKKSSASENTSIAEKPIVVETITEVAKTKKSKKSSYSEKTPIAEVAKNKSKSKKPSSSPEPLVAEKSSIAAESKLKKSSAPEKTAEKSSAAVSIPEVDKIKSKKSSAPEKTPTAEKSSVAESTPEVDKNKPNESEKTPIAKKLTVAESIPEVAEIKSKKSSVSKKTPIAEKSFVAESIPEVHKNKSKKSIESENTPIVKKLSVAESVPEMATNQSDKSSASEKPLVAGKSSVSAEKTTTAEKSIVLGTISDVAKSIKISTSEKTLIAEKSIVVEPIPEVTKNKSKKFVESQIAEKSTVESTPEVAPVKSKKIGEAENSQIAIKSIVSETTLIAEKSIVVDSKNKSKKSRTSGKTPTAARSIAAKSTPEVAENKSEKSSASEKPLVAAKSGASVKNTQIAEKSNVVETITEVAKSIKVSAPEKTSIAEKSIVVESLPEVLIDKSKKSSVSGNTSVAEMSSVSKTTEVTKSKSKKFASEKAQTAEKSTVESTPIKSKKCGVAESISEVATETIIVENKSTKSSASGNTSIIAEKSETIPEVAKNKSTKLSEKARLAEKSTVAEASPEVAKNKSKKVGKSEKTSIAEKSTVESIPEGTKNKSKQVGESEKTPIVEPIPEVATNKSKKSDKSDSFPVVAEGNSKKSRVSENTPIAEKSSVTKTTPEVAKGKSKKSAESEKTPIAKEATVAETMAENIPKSSETVIKVGKNNKSKKSTESKETFVAKQSSATANKPKDNSVSKTKAKILSGSTSENKSETILGIEKKPSAIEISKEATAEISLAAEIEVQESTKTTATEKNSDIILATKISTQEGNKDIVVSAASETKKAIEATKVLETPNLMAKTEQTHNTIPVQQTTEALSNEPKTSSIAVAIKLEATNLKETVEVAEKQTKKADTESHVTELWDLECENEIEVQSTDFENAYGALCESIAQDEKHDSSIKHVDKEKHKPKIEAVADKKRVTKRLSKLDDSDSEIEIEIKPNSSKRRRKDKVEDADFKESKLLSRENDKSKRSSKKAEDTPKKLDTAKLIDKSHKDTVEIPKEKISKDTSKPKEVRLNPDEKTKVKSNVDSSKIIKESSESTAKIVEKPKEKGSDKKGKDKKDPFDELIKSSKSDKNKEKSSRSEHASRLSMDKVKSKNDEVKKSSKAPSPDDIKSEKSKSSEKSEKLTKKDERPSRRGDRSLEKKPTKDEMKTDKKIRSTPQSPATEVETRKNYESPARSSKKYSSSKEAKSSKNDKVSTSRDLKRSKSEASSTKSPEREVKISKVEAKSAETPVKELKKSKNDTSSTQSPVSELQSISKSEKSSSQSQARESRSSKSDGKEKSRKSYEEAKKDNRTSRNRAKRNESSAKVSKHFEEDTQKPLKDKDAKIVIEKDDKLSATKTEEIKSEPKSKDEKAAKEKDVVSNVEDNKVQQKSAKLKDEKTHRIEENKSQKKPKGKDEKTLGQAATKTEEGKLLQQKTSIDVKTSQDKECVTKSEENKLQPKIIKEKALQDKAASGNSEEKKLQQETTKGKDQKGVSAEKTKVLQKESNIKACKPEANENTEKSRRKGNKHDNSIKKLVETKIQENNSKSSLEERASADGKAVKPEESKLERKVSKEETSSINPEKNYVEGIAEIPVKSERSSRLDSSTKTVQITIPQERVTKSSPEPMLVSVKAKRDDKEKLEKSSLERKCKITPSVSKEETSSINPEKNYVEGIAEIPVKSERSSRLDSSTKTVQITIPQENVTKSSLEPMLVSAKAKRDDKEKLEKSSLERKCKITPSVSKEETSSINPEKNYVEGIAEIPVKSERSSRLDSSTKTVQITIPQENVTKSSLEPMLVSAKAKRDDKEKLENSSLERKCKITPSVSKEETSINNPEKNYVEGIAEIPVKSERSNRLESSTKTVQITIPQEKVTKSSLEPMLVSAKAKKDDKEKLEKSSLERKCKITPSVSGLTPTTTASTEIPTTSTEIPTASTPKILPNTINLDEKNLYIILDNRLVDNSDRKRKPDNNDSSIIETTPKKVKTNVSKDQNNSTLEQNSKKRKSVSVVVQETKKLCVNESKTQLLTKPEADKQFCELEPLVTEIIAKNIEPEYSNILDNLNLVEQIAESTNMVIAPNNTTVTDSYLEPAKVVPLDFFITEEVQTTQNESVSEVAPAVELGQSEDDKAVENNLEGSAALLYANDNHTVDQRHFENFYNDIMINQFTEFLETNDTVETGLAFDPVNANASATSAEYQMHQFSNNQFNSIYPGPSRDCLVSNTHLPSAAYQTISVNTELENQQQLEDHSYADVVETVENFHKSIQGSPIDAAISPQSSEASTIKSLVIDQDNLEMQYTQFDAMYQENTNDCIMVSAVPTTISQTNHYQSIGVSSTSVQSESVENEQSREPTLGSDHTTSTMDLLISGSLESETPESETPEIGETTVSFNTSDNPLILDDTLEPLDIFFLQSGRKTYAHIQQLNNIIDDVSVGDILEPHKTEQKMVERSPQKLTPSPTPDVEPPKSIIPKKVVFPPQKVKTPPTLPTLLSPEYEPPKNIIPKKVEHLKVQTPPPKVTTLTMHEPATEIPKRSNQKRKVKAPPRKNSLPQRTTPTSTITSDSSTNIPVKPMQQLLHVSQGLIPPQATESPTAHTSSLPSLGDNSPIVGLRVNKPSMPVLLLLEQSSSPITPSATQRSCPESPVRQGTRSSTKKMQEALKLSKTQSKVDPPIVDPFDQCKNQPIQNQYFVRTASGGARKRQDFRKSRAEEPEQSTQPDQPGFAFQNFHQRHHRLLISQQKQLHKDLHINLHNQDVQKQDAQRREAQRQEAERQEAIQRQQLTKLQALRLNVGQESHWNPATATAAPKPSGSSKSKSDPYEHGAFVDGRLLPTSSVFPGQVRPEPPNPGSNRKTDPYTPVHGHGVMPSTSFQFHTVPDITTASIPNKGVKPETPAAKNIPLFPDPGEASKTSKQEKKSPKKKEDPFEWGHQLFERLKEADCCDSLRLPGTARHT